VADGLFASILCSEALERVPEPARALDEFARLTGSDGKLIVTVPFASVAHMAPYHICSGFSRYWCEHHLPIRGFNILGLIPNGDWFAYLQQDLIRLGKMER
jgi:ubiquinone/menaquinone biosynthesis C-methylase UbiE